MEQFFQQLAVIHPMLEPIGRWMIIVVVGFIFWLVLSVPAALLHSAISKYLLRVYDFFMSLRDTVWSSAKLMAAGLGDAKAKFVSTSRLMFGLDYYDKEIRNIVTIARQKLEETDKRIGTHTSGFEDNVVKLGQSSEEIIQQVNDFSGSIPHEVKLAVPEIDTVVDESMIHREGIVKLVIGLLGGFALIAINTMLLNQFFESFISMHVLGFRVSMILSLFFSFLEAVLGVVLYFQQKKLKGEDIRHHLGEMMIFALIGLLMIIEFVLYMVLSGQMDPEVFVSIFAPEPVPHYFKFWLAPFGLVVVGVLAFCGHLFIEGLYMLMQTTVLGSIDKRIEEYEKLTRNLNKGIKNINDLAGKAKQGLESYVAELRGVEGNKPTIAEDIIKSTQELTEMAEVVAVERSKPVEAKNTDVESSYYQYIFFGVATLIVTGLFVWCQVNFLDKLALFNTDSDYLYLVIALVEVVALLAAGYALARPKLLMMDEGAAAIIEEPASRWIVAVLITIVIGILGFNAFLIVRENSASEWSWLMLMVACIGALLYFGRNLKHILSACWCFIGVVARALSLIVPVIFAVLCHIVSWLGKIADVVIEAVAYPTIKIYQYFSNRKQEKLPANKTGDSNSQQVVA